MFRVPARSRRRGRRSVGDRLGVRLKVEMVYGGGHGELERLDGGMGLTKMEPVSELKRGDGEWTHG